MCSSATRGKLIVLSAPSGSGKSTLVNYLVGCKNLNLLLSVSATSRVPRENEVNGKHYHFLSEEDFMTRIDQDDFLEYEEVYPNHFYGTLRNEVDCIWNSGHHVIFDIDVVGGLNIKMEFPSQTLTIFINPPSILELRKRLEIRNTDSPKKIDMRIKKAEKELQDAKYFDFVLKNNDLDIAKKEIYEAVSSFLKN